MNVFEALMQFCPRCGKRLPEKSEPAECGRCGWKEKGVTENEQADLPGNDEE